MILHPGCGFRGVLRHHTPAVDTPEGVHLRETLTVDGTSTPVAKVETLSK